MDITAMGIDMPNQHVVEQQLEELRVDMREIRTAMTQMAVTLTKLSVLEERNLVAAAAIEKMDSRIARVETKAADIELSRVKFEATVGGMSKAMRWMWGAFGGGVLYLGAQAIKAFALAIGG